METDGKNPNRVAGGLKATLNNPNVSDETKSSAQQRLDGMDLPSESERNAPPSPTGMSKQQLGGYKATLSNDNSTDEAKSRARDVLQSADRDQL